MAALVEPGPWLARLVEVSCWPSSGRAWSA